MIRSQNSNVTVIDKLTMLWVLCTIDWCHTNNIPLSNNNLDELFGEKVKSIFNFYREAGIDFQYINKDSVHLTDKGQKLVDNWQQIQIRILDI